MKYKLVVAYDGTDFKGWQWQQHVSSIVHVMQHTFTSVFNQNITLIGSSRTDAGVHALGQVATFSTALNLESRHLMTVWNDALPPTIVIQSLEPVHEDFHPIYGVAQKIYWYHFFLERPLPFMQRYGWFFRYNIDTHRLQEALSLFVGTHDFRSFCTGTDMSTTIRTIDAIELSKELFGVWRITVKGAGFLRHMVRRIVGACMQAASKKDLSVADLKRALDQKNPQQYFMTAPAKGLCLYTVHYK